MQDFRDLKVWQRAHQLTMEVYGATKAFPAEERFGLTSQIRRSCASIPTNIAEGCGRSGAKELRRFLDIAMGSAGELEYQLLLTHDLGFLTDVQHTELHETTCQIKRMLTAFIRKLTNDK